MFLVINTFVTLYLCIIVKIMPFTSHLLIKNVGFLNVAILYILYILLALLANINELMISV